MQRHSNLTSPFNSETRLRPRIILVSLFTFQTFVKVTCGTHCLKGHTSCLHLHGQYSTVLYLSPVCFHKVCDICYTTGTFYLLSSCFHGIRGDMTIEIKLRWSSRTTSVSWIVVVAFLFLQLAIPSRGCFTRDDADDCRALAALFHSVSPPLPWPIGTAGENMTSHCTWTGVACCGKNRVCEVDLHNMGLKGVLPSEVALLSSLQRLYLWANELSGTIPVGLGQLPHLTDIELSENLLQGSIPESLGEASALEYLGLAYNKLTGTVPPVLGRLSQLRTLKADYNQLQGSIPSDLGNARNLTYLILSYNQLSGTIPSSLGRLERLFDLELHNNYLTEIPPGLSECHSLTSLSLGFNNISHNIPDSLGKMTSLVALFLENNNIQGTIPPALGNLSKTLLQLELDHNSLTGTIPPDLGDLVSLETLHLDENHLLGSIPASISNLTNIVSMKMHSNNLTGFIPAAVESLICALENESAKQCSLFSNEFSPADCAAAPCAVNFCGMCQ